MACAPEIHQGRPELAELRGLGAQIEQVPNYSNHSGRMEKLRSVLSGEWSEVRHLRKVLTDFQPDLVFLNQGGTADALAEPDLLDYLMRRETPYVLFCRSNQRSPPLGEVARSKVIQLYSGAYKVLFNSAWMLDLTQKQLMMKLPNAGLFPHLVRFDYPSPLSWPASDVPLLASISRLDTFHKGLDALLEAVALLRKDDVKFLLEIAGDGPDRAYLENYAKFLRVDDVVHFTGRRENVREVWRRNQILVLVSRYEGLAVSMLEAMACGRPVLRTPYGGSDWIEDGKTGFICPAPEPELIAATIRRALTRHADWPQMGLAAHEALVKRLPKDPEKIYLDIADEVCSSATTQR